MESCGDNTRKAPEQESCSLWIIFHRRKCPHYRFRHSEHIGKELHLRQFVTSYRICHIVLYPSMFHNLNLMDLVRKVKRILNDARINDCHRKQIQLGTSFAISVPPCINGYSIDYGNRIIKSPFAGIDIKSYI